MIYNTAFKDLPTIQKSKLYALGKNQDKSSLAYQKIVQMLGLQTEEPILESQVPFDNSLILWIESSDNVQ